MTLEQAIKIAEQERGKFEYSTVDSALDCNDRWIFTFAQDKGMIGTAPMVVFKETGECEIFYFTSENLEIARRGKNVPLPEEAHND